MRASIRLPHVAMLGTLAGLTTACGRDRLPRRPDITVLTQEGAAAKARSWTAADWQPPALSSLPSDSLGASIRRGLALIIHTPDSLPHYVGGNLACASCHLQEGRRADAAPLNGVFARYPKYLDRSAAVIPIEDRVNYCFTRSLAGSRIPNHSREMQDIVAYLAFLSRGVPVGAHVKNEGMPTMVRLTGDSARGQELFAATCARCHGADGAGVAAVPAVWGPKSFSIGASMAREERAASFIRHNMPFDTPGVLTDQQAYDVAAYVTSMPRPDLPGKEHDWPVGGTPSDAPYNTVDHRAYHPPRLLPRPARGDALVPPPAPIAHR